MIDDHAHSFPLEFSPLDLSAIFEANAQAVYRLG